MLLVWNHCRGARKKKMEKDVSDEGQVIANEFAAVAHATATATASVASVSSIFHVSTCRIFIRGDNFRYASQHTTSICTKKSAFFHIYVVLLHFYFLLQVVWIELCVYIIRK